MYPSTSVRLRLKAHGILHSRHRPRVYDLERQHHTSGAYEYLLLNWLGITADNITLEWRKNGTRFVPAWASANDRPPQSRSGSV